MRRVVVTGLGVVSPIGIGVDAFYDGLRHARSGIGLIRSFDASTFPTRIAGEVTGDVPIPVWVAEPLGSAINRDRKACFAVAAADQALTEAFSGGSIGSSYAPDRIGTYLGAGLEIFHLDDLAPHVRGGELDGASLLASLRDAPAFSRMQIPSHLASSAVAAHARAEGPLAVNVSACTAAAQAIGEAFLAVQDDVLDAAIVGGYDSMVNPLGVGGFCMLEALSRANHLGGAASRPFDLNRDGFVLGEGSAVLILEELNAAHRRNAPIYAELLAYASSLDAYRVSDPDPSLQGAVSAMAQALARARLEPSDVDYINAHGTGTRKNDPMESRAIRRVFGSVAGEIPVSSTKSQVGHLIGAAGAVELIACIFALTEGIVPATINLDTPDPECDLDYVPKKPRARTVRTALSNSFGFGGQNACIAIGRLRG
ncbi:MAG: beta-ketoacyl-[acyl-carrier-protein] synthase family protein [Acidobacteriota bacterium]